MKKLIFLFAISFPFFSCETRNAEVTSTDVIIEGRTVRTYTIDSCEYIGNIYGGSGDWLSHKGNCKFCEEKNRQIIREEIENSKNNY